MGLCIRTRKREIKESDYNRILVPNEWKNKTVKEFISSKKSDAPIFLENSDVRLFLLLLLFHYFHCLFNLSNIEE